MKKQITLSGTGGQGLLTAGIILAEAAILEGLNAVQTQSYGPEARGGASKSDVIISDGEIDFPKVLAADVLMAMSQEACDKYIKQLAPSGILIIDKTLVPYVPKTRARVVAADVTKLTRARFGTAVYGNILALGVLIGVTGLLPEATVAKAVLARVPKGTEKSNTDAFNYGLELAAGSQG
ncbi:MAG: 2-oxoacid:acceptor oxidoreductase family protein [Negativicutes bacterium]|nr:2-oxoacid:acceptor oxidoreductase family protein [Negativicutes bacterium]